MVVVDGGAVVVEDLGVADVVDVVDEPLVVVGLVVVAVANLNPRNCATRACLSCSFWAMISCRMIS